MPPAAELYSGGLQRIGWCLGRCTPENVRYDVNLGWGRNVIPSRQREAVFQLFAPSIPIRIQSNCSFHSHSSASGSCHSSFIFQCFMFRLSCFLEQVEVQVQEGGLTLFFSSISSSQPELELELQRRQGRRHRLGGMSMETESTWTDHLGT